MNILKRFNHPFYRYDEHNNCCKKSFGIKRKYYAFVLYSRKKIKRIPSKNMLISNENETKINISKNSWTFTVNS